MQGVARLLMSLGCVVSVVDPEGLPEAYDAADAVRAGLAGAGLNEWLKPRIKPFTLFAPEPQAVLAPEAGSGAVTIEGKPEAATAGLKMGSRGPHQNLGNTRILVGTLIETSGVLPGLWYDSFLGQVRTPDGEWSDRDTLALLSRLQNDFSFERLTRETLEQAVTLYAWEHPRNCAQEWLHGLTWDGTVRLEYFLEDAFGTVRTPYTQAVGRCFLMGMVARVLMPGCQVDNLPVFEGAQGITKSRALRALGGSWYAEAMESVVGKDFYLALAGKILVEVAEFSSFTRAENEAIKAAIARPTDRYRAPYGRRPEDHPRANVFAATTNEQEWNRDPTGARRFWPVRCGEINVEWIEACREPLFAEARERVLRVAPGCAPGARVAAGAAWWDVPLEEARQEQAGRFESDTVAEAMKYYVATHPHFTTLEVITFGLNLEGPQRFDRVLQNRVKAQLVQWGYRLEERPGVEGRRWWPRD
jgi:Virulence-associated protein E